MATIPGRQGMHYKIVLLDPLLTFALESPALNVYDTIAKCGEQRRHQSVFTLILFTPQLFQLNQTSDSCVPCMKLGWTQPSIYIPLSLLDGLIIKCSPLRVLTTEYADWAEMDPNQAHQKCVRRWVWLEAEDFNIGRFEEAECWGTLSIVAFSDILLILLEYDGFHMGIAFNPNQSTWRQEDDELSMCAIGSGSG